MSRSMSAKGVVCVAAALLMAGGAWADDFMGEYEGTFIPDKKVTMKAEAKVVAEGDGNYRIVIEAKSEDRDRDGAYIEVYGKQSGQAVIVDSGVFGGYIWKGEIRDGRLVLETKYGTRFELKKIERKSPRAGLKPPAGAVVLLPFKNGQKGKADLSEWTNGKWKALPGGVMECVPKSGSSRTNKVFGDIETLHVEFKLPLEPKNRGQGRANSGVYVSGKYEVQILDSFGILPYTSGDCGGIYNLKRADVNACLPPERWQTYDITFHRPGPDADGKMRGPRITVEHNGRTIHKNLEMPAKSKPGEKGPLNLQDHKHPIQFRNIWLVEG